MFPGQGSLRSAEHGHAERTAPAGISRARARGRAKDAAYASNSGAMQVFFCLLRQKFVCNALRGGCTFASIRTTVRRPAIIKQNGPAGRSDRARMTTRTSAFDRGTQTKPSRSRKASAGKCAARVRTARGGMRPDHQVAEFDRAFGWADFERLWRRFYRGAQLGSFGSSARIQRLFGA